MTPRQNDVLLIALFALSVLISGIAVASAESLGVPPQFKNWLIVLQPVLLYIANQLKALGASANGQSPIQQPPGDRVADAPIGRAR